MVTWAEFIARRKGHDTQFFPYEEGTPRGTVMVCSHIWWTEQIGLAFLQAGYNVLMHFPLYLLYTDEAAHARFDELWANHIQLIRQHKVQVIVGGNTGALAANPKTGELLHEAAGVRLVNWWWDEPRARPPLARAFGPADYVRFLGSAGTLNAIWDIDVKEELEAQLGLRNLMHLPLATLPEFWPSGFMALAKRPLAACFLGNCHFAAEWAETDQDPLFVWAREVVARKLAAPDTPMQACIAAAGNGAGVPRESPLLTGGKDPWMDFLRPWDVLNAVYMHRTRNLVVQAAVGYLKGKLALIGKGWEKLGLRANMEHAAEGSGIVYAQSQVSLNLTGGCVHGGMPLRPYDICASGGLLVTHYQRELPSLFEEGKECLVFRTPDEMVEQVQRVRAAPADFDAVAQAGRTRVLAHHTWSHRVEHLLARLAALTRG